MRICSLLPGATEIAFALGLGELVMGVSHECDFPAAAKDKLVVVRSRIDSATTTSKEIDQQVRAQLNQTQSLYALDLQRLEQIKPDLILTQELCQIRAVDYTMWKKRVSLWYLAHELSPWPRAHWRMFSMISIASPRSPT